MNRIQAIGAAVLLAGAMVAAQAQEEEGSFEKTVPARANGEVEITNVSGTVQIAGWDRNEVEVRAELGDEVERVEVTEDGGNTRIRVIVPRRGGDDTDADLQVRVPHGSGLSVSTVSADITARGLTGEQRLKSVSGNVRSEIAARDIEVKTVSGDLWLRGKAQPASVRMSTVSGNVRLDGGAGVVEAVTTSGDFNLDVSAAKSVRVRTTSGSLDFRGKLLPDAELDAESVSGDLNVRAAAEKGYDFEISTFSGDIENCFNLDAVNTNRYGPGRRLTGKQGDGGARVRIQTMSGDVEVCDK
jgi:DUF4097 and DUF4098 domain-containing protein YvlB